MGLSDVHTILGVLIGRLFHRPQQSSLRTPPASFPSSLRARLMSSPRAPLSRYVAAGIVMANLPDLDVLLVLYKRSLKEHRGPTHSVLSLFLAGLVSTLPLSLWLRVGPVRAVLFAWACLGSHLASDWIGNAGVSLWWPLSSSRASKQALGAVTVMDLPLAASAYLAFELRRKVRPHILLASLAVFWGGYLRFKRTQLSAASAVFRQRHLYAPGEAGYWIHPWACFPLTFSLVRSADQQIVETVSNASQSTREPLKGVNVSPGPQAVRRMMMRHRGVLLDALFSGSLMAAFWIWQLIRFRRRLYLKSLPQ